jgi:hypothetical protein
MAIDIKRALKDKAYLDSLDKEDLKTFLESAAGKQELDESELDQVAGGLPQSDGNCGTTGSCLAKKRSQLIC